MGANKKSCNYNCNEELKEDVKYLLSISCPINVMSIILNVGKSEILKSIVEIEKHTQDQDEGKAQEDRFEPIPESEGYRYGQLRAKQYAEKYAKVDTKRIKRDIELYTAYKKLLN